MIGDTSLPLKDALLLEAYIEQTREEQRLISVFLKNCEPIIRQGVVDIAYKSQATQSDIVRGGIRVGIDLLWAINGIDKIRKIRFEVDQLTDNQSLRGWFDSGDFTIFGKAKLFFRIDSKTHGECGGLASALGLNLNTIFQLCLMAGLIHSETISYEDRAKMIEISVNFMNWLTNRIENARMFKEMAQKGKKINTRRLTSWDEDVLNNHTLQNPVSLE